MGLRSAVAINVATMVGAGPFITLPLVVSTLHGVSALAWVVGAVIALCDGLVWAELGSRYPRSGGTYTFLREAFGPRGPGRFVAFLFVWQFLFWAPLILASGYIGFAQYASYVLPALGAPAAAHAVAVGVGVVTLVALYRPIPQIARTALALGAVALVTLVVVALAGLSHPYAPPAVTIAATFSLQIPLAALGAALVITLYDYGGYGDVCALGDEVVAPARTIPRAVVLSVLFVGAAYVLLNLGVAAALPAADIAKANAIAALVAERAFGVPFAICVTVAVLVTAFGSTYGLLLAAARIPFAAARNGEFLAPFARLHRRGGFPAFSLVAIGLLALPASLFSLDQVIAALTAGIVLVQGVGQVIALALARRAQQSAPFRIPLYPLPPLIALAGWLYLFVSTGAIAIAFGLVTLAAGALVYLVRARRIRIWPFGASAVASVVAIASFALAAPAAAQNDPAAPSFGHAILLREAPGSQPTLTLDGKPFFFLGGAFFYERIAPSDWRRSMLRMRAIGANTLDLYVPWNWHELADGDFDFTGRTSPRRDLREVLRLGKELGFFFIVRPGPVIRNEWRNGGYPAWLLQRPEYGMPLHDVLEGRYPATATLQNTRSDDAAAEWLQNPEHVRYASRWLRRALGEFRPVADRVLAVQLDDDQGAYLDNDTYPAPHLHAYLAWLDEQVRTVVGPLTPTFINTFEMKVPSSSPVWAMGNWYQSDAYAIGEHDRAELAFATASLRTQARGPLAISEFQAGWLAPPGDPQPRRADPTNTTLALGELTGWGMKGLVDFPLQDTLAPFGWEAPFSNALYSWDAAFALDGEPHDRYWRTAAMFGQLAFYGPLLAEATRVAEIAVPYDGRRDAFQAAAAVKAALAACRRRGLGCDVVDPLTVSEVQLRAYRYLAIPRASSALAARAARAHVRIVPSVDSVRGPARPLGATLLRGSHGTLLVLENWKDVASTFDVASISASAAGMPPLVLGPRDARIVALNVDLGFLSPRFRAGERLTTTCRTTPSPDGGAAFVADAGNGRNPDVARGAHCAVAATLAGAAQRWELDADHRLSLAPDATPAPRARIIGRDRFTDPGVQLSADARFRTPHFDDPLPGIRAYRADVFEDGSREIVLKTARTVAIIAPDGGARVVSFGTFEGEQLGRARQIRSMFDATGALRDDVLIQPPPSATDRIAKYTHLYPAGLFNRAYDACTFETERGAGAYLAYDAPDTVPPARFERVVFVVPGADRLVVDERFTPSRRADAQRLVSLSAIRMLPSLDDGHPAMLRAGPDRLPLGRAANLDARSGGVSVTSAEYLPVFSVAWRPGDVESASWSPATSNGTLRLVFAPGGWRRLTFLYADAADARAQQSAEAERAWVAANPPPNDGEVAKRYTQSPQKRPSESSCGFESHLPQ